MPEALQEQVAAYEALLPEIRNRFGSPVWVLVVHKKLVSTFAEFADAARFALKNYPDEQVLIRNTSETVEMAPFVFVEE